MTNRNPRRGTPAGRSPATILALVLGAAGLALGGAALAIVLVRGNAQGCRQAAWSALPAVGSLPAGWSMSASGIYIDSVGTTLTGPEPSASDAETPAIFVSVGCYGADAHDGVVRSHAVAVSGGAADVGFPAIGDESFATHDDQSGEYSVVVRRGDLVATLAAAGAVSVDDLTTAARAVDSAMAKGPTTADALPSAAGSVAAGGSGAAASAPGGGSDASPEPSDVPEEATHDAPDLEKLLPTTVEGVSLERTSFAASDVLGADESSQALTKALDALGKTPKDLQIAEAYDVAGTADWYVDAFRLPGLSGGKLSGAIRDGWLDGGSSDVKSSTVKIGGKQVTRLDRGADTPGDYVYVHDDVVFDIATSDEKVATDVLALLP